MLRCSIEELRARILPIVGIVHNFPKTTNKGEVGLWLETKTGIPHSPACLDCSDGELKTFPLKKSRGSLVPKETLAVTMLSTDSLKIHSYEESRCCKKMERLLCVPYLREGDTILFYEPTLVCATTHKHLFDTVKNDYEKIRSQYIESGTLTSSVGDFLQNRTKGPGGNAPKTRAFYLKKEFLKKILV